MTEETEQARDSVVARYSQLVRDAAAGDHVTDGEGCFGAAAYGDTAGLPESALRASLGCGNRSGRRAGAGRDRGDDRLIAPGNLSSRATPALSTSPPSGAG